MENKFKTSKFNKIYLFLTIATYTFFWVAYADKGARQYGEFSSMLTFFILLPILVSWAIWRIRSKKENAGNITFNIALTIIILSQFVQTGEIKQQNEASNDFHDKKNQLHQELSKAKDMDEYISTHQKLSDTVKNEITRLSKESSGDQKQFYEIMGEFMTENQNNGLKWQNAYKAVLDQRILNYSFLTDDKEFMYQKSVLNNYIKQTKSYRDKLNNLVSDFKIKLGAIGENNQLAIEAIQGMAKKCHSQRPILDPLMQAHLDYGEDMIQMLDILQQNKELWSFQDEDITISNEEVKEKYNQALVEMRKNEKSINQLSDILTLTQQK